MGGYLGTWGSPHTCVHAHTCIHVQKLQMTVDMEASMFIMFILINMYVHVYICVHMHASMGHLSTYPCLLLPPSTPSATPSKGDPWNQSKFNRTRTNQDISILFKDLKSVENSPSMGGCVVW